MFASKTPPSFLLPLGAGCRDYAPYLGLSSAVGMWRALGPERCRAYCSDTLAAAVQLLTGSWGSATLAPMCMSANMALVGLPARLVAAIEALERRAESEACAAGAAAGGAAGAEPGSSSPADVQGAGQAAQQQQPAAAAAAAVSAGVGQLPGSSSGAGQAPASGTATSADAKLIQVSKLTEVQSQPGCGSHDFFPTSNNAASPLALWHGRKSVRHRQTIIR
jgi:hypothetical protein